jgi:hypothetical protein
MIEPNETEEKIAPKALREQRNAIKAKELNVDDYDEVDLRQIEGEKVIWKNY